MTNFPNQLDDDSDLPRVEDNLSEIGAEAINAQRDTIFALESNIGINAQGSLESIAARLSVSIEPDGTINPSILIGLLSLVQISNTQVSPTAAIDESKLNLAFSTTSLYNLANILKNSIDVLNGFLSLTGVKLEPHIDGTGFNHLLSAIHVDTTAAMLKTSPSTVPSVGTNVINRNTTNSDTLVQDISNDLLIHEKADGSINITPSTGGTVPPVNFAHVAAGIYVDPNSFSTIPQSLSSAQEIFNYIDDSSLLLLGSRTQNLYSNGISHTSRSSSFFADGYGEPVVQPTPCIAYFLNQPPGPISSSPIDDFQHGDDIILFAPTADQLNSFNFDAQFAQVQPGDLITINYGTGISYQFLVDSTKSGVNGSVRTYAVRINGRNPVSNTNAVARIDRSTFHRGKFGVLASARAPNSLGTYESLIVANPKAAAVLGINFNPSMIDSTHYNLYLYLLPTGVVSNMVPLPAIDITGNKGTTPGQYTLTDLVNATNIAFRAPGFNYRFIAFDYLGQFGIMLADPYNNASFSVVSGTVDGYGNYTSTSLSAFPNNTVDNFGGIDPIGFGLNAANIASPPPSVAYGSVSAARFNPTVLFYPLKRNFFYVDGVERDSLKSDPSILNNITDTFGDGYWPATILPAPFTNILPNRVEVVYQVNLDLSDSNLRAGKTIVVQPSLLLTDFGYSFRDYGRFIIKNVAYNNCGMPNAYTNITVYDGVHAAGVSPAATSTNIPVHLYFSDDSVSFDAENVADITTSGPYKRFFEVYIDSSGHTFSHERARFINTGNDIANINLYEVSRKLRGYNVSNDREIRLTITSYDQTTGIFAGFLARWNSISLTTSNPGPITTGKKGEIVRFYDETSIDYIDFIFDIETSLATFTNKAIDIQLFKTLELDGQLMIVSSCQIDDVLKQTSYLKDARAFGNVSEEQLSTSALSYIAAPQKLLESNGVINGFDNLQVSTNTINFNGGTALVNGKITFINNTSITIPAVIEILFPAFSTTVSTITWFICANDKGEVELIASTDFLPSSLSTYGSLTQDRLFYVSNPLVSAIPYTVRATYFANLISSYKDLTPLYIATATVTGTTISALSATDAREYVSGGYSGVKNAFILSNEGQFRTFAAANTWLNQFTSFISFTNLGGPVRGTAVDIMGTVAFTSALTLSYTTDIQFQGNGGTINFGTNAINIANNISFSNLTINAVSSTLTIGNNISFTNCTINFPVSVSFTGSNITFTNCIINLIGTLTIGSATFDDCTIAIPVQTGFILTGKNTFNNCSISYTYDATSNVSFVAANPANISSAALLCNISSSGISNITINDCSFSSPNVNRFSFISFLFASSVSNLENVTIADNLFATSYPADDRGAIIAFAAPNATVSSITGPRLTNCNIENNHCNKNQLILISSIQDPTTFVVNDAIVAVNTRIVGNTCGAICALTKRDTPKAVYGGMVLDKEECLYIARNTCRFIYTGFADGTIVSTANLRAISYIVAGIFTGSILIEENVCSFIHLGLRTSSTAYTANNPLLKIRLNKLTATNPDGANGAISIYYRGFSGLQTSTAIIVDKVSGS